MVIVINNVIEMLLLWKVNKETKC